MKKLLIVIGVLLVFITAFVLKTLHDAGEFKTLKPHFNGTVTQIPGVIGAEDITIDHEKRIAYISADDRFATLNGNKGFGGLYVLHVDSQSASPKLMKRIPDGEIHPHGIFYHKSPEGKSFLYVVNHTEGQHSILLYRFRDDTTLVLGRSYRDSTFIISPNDVVAVDEKRFYFTNDHGSHSAFGKKLEDYLQLKKSNVVYYDGEIFSIAAKHIAYANGININREFKDIYVASTIGKSVLLYKRDDSTGQLTLSSEIELNTGVDNIELDEQGNLWVGCHPKLLTFVQHAKDTATLAPSQVFKISLDPKILSEEIYLNNGEELSASSVAAVSGNTMLVGAVLDGNILRCELDRQK